MANITTNRAETIICRGKTQEQQGIEALLAQGGYATLRRLNEVIDFSTWETKTPEASVRRTVQKSNAIFRIQPGLWALEEYRDKLLEHFKIKEGDSKSIEMFNHAYYQGLLIEIGHYRRSSTYVPPQDQHRLFLDKELGDLTDHKTIPAFTVAEAGFSIDNAVARPLLTRSVLRDIKIVVDYLWEDELRHYQENSYPQEHIFLVLQRLRGIL